MQAAVSLQALHQPPTLKASLIDLPTTTGPPSPIVKNILLATPMLQDPPEALNALDDHDWHPPNHFTRDEISQRVKLFMGLWLPQLT